MKWACRGADFSPEFCSQLQSSNIMKKFSAYFITITLLLCLWQGVHAQGNPEFSRLSKEGFEAAKNKDWDKAVEAYRRATQIDRKASQNFSAALRQRAFVYQSQQKYQQAAADYDEALKITHNDPE